MKYLFHPNAEIELNFSVDYYQQIDNSIAKNFISEIYNSIDRIINHPQAWQTITQNIKNIRRCVVNKFPFAVVYYQRDNTIIIVAIMHLNRKPNYWLERV